VSDDDPTYRGGAGDPVVLVHGGTGTRHLWDAVIPRLTPHHEVLAPTLPGHRGGEPIGPGATVDVFVDGLEKAMDEAGFDRAHLVGNSLGGWVAMELSRRGRAQSVVALSPAGGWVDGDAHVWRQVRAADLQVRWFRHVIPVLFRSDVLRRIGLRAIAAHGDRLSREEALDMLDGARGADLANILAAARRGVQPFPDDGVPVLLAWSELDRTVPLPRYSDPWRKAVPHAEWRVLPGVGHLPMIDDPELVTRTILDWTASH
jgi:pimeloyl-ACP methyl ester carboxylesterase